MKNTETQPRVGTGYACLAPPPPELPPHMVEVMDDLEREWYNDDIEYWRGRGRLELVEGAERYLRHIVSYDV
jgi:hypothetical protein